MYSKGCMRIPYDLFVWIVSLSLVAFIPLDTDLHSTWCPLDRLGFDWCPGCGLGRSMKYLMVGDWEHGWEMHPLGGFALVVIGLRIGEIIRMILQKGAYLRQKGFTSGQNEARQ